MVIVKPAIMISTKEAFANITPKEPAKCCKDIVKQPIETWKEELVNDFEQSISNIHPEIIKIKNKLYELGAIYVSMTGSGSALYGIFKDNPDNLYNAFNNCFICVV